MQSTDETRAEKQAARWLLLGYCVFVVYGSFIPFRFNFDPGFVRWRWSRFIFALFHGQLTWSSNSDVLSNVLLYVPFGVLWFWARLAAPTRRGALAPTLMTGLMGFLFGLAVECGQTLSPFRNPSLLDALCNGAGALLGAIPGAFLLRTYQGSLEPKIAYLLGNRRSLIVLAYLLFGIIMHSFFPFDVTLELTIIWQNLKQSQFVPFQNGFPPLGSIALIEQAAIYFAMGYLVLINLRRGRHDSRGALAWLCTTTLALAVETAKLFFNGRAFRSGNLVIAATVALLGILALPKLFAASWMRIRLKEFAFALLLAFLLYFELAPFDWVSLGELRLRLPTIEWLPFKAYYSAEPLVALFDFEKKFYYAIPLGYIALALISHRRGVTRRWLAALLCCAIAAALETAQIAVRSRTPSLTDVIVLTAGAWLGIVLFEFGESLRPHPANVDK